MLTVNKESLLDKMEAVRSYVIPEHVAIIMDGNRRWAKQGNLPTFCGHWKGAEGISDLVKLASDVGVKVLTLYAFSTENWSRSQEEVAELMKLIVFYLQENVEFMIEQSVKLETIGDIAKLPLFVQECLQETKLRTAAGGKIRLVLALNYGGRDEICRAVKRIVEDVEKGMVSVQALSEPLISRYLDTAEWKDPDLLIRTSGEQRLSNFLLWQLSYTEVYVTKVLWPDFTGEDFLEAIMEFQKRHRRLGGA